MRSTSQQTHVTRQWLLSRLGASLTLIGSAGQTFAEGREKTENLPSSSRAIDNTPPKRKSKKLDVIYTQRNLKNVKEKDLKTAIRANKQGHNVVIEGFSKSMSSIIFESMLADKSYTLQFINGMAKVKKKSERRKRLKLYMEGTEAEIRHELIDFKRLERILFDDDPFMIRIKQMQKLLRIWEQSPMEGSSNKVQKNKPAKKKPKKTSGNVVTDFFTNLTGTEAPKSEDKAGFK